MACTAGDDMALGIVKIWRSCLCGTGIDETGTKCFEGWQAGDVEMRQAG